MEAHLGVLRRAPGGELTVCTHLTLEAGVSGSGLGSDGWFHLGQTVVYFDHPQHAAAEHAVCIDFRGSAAHSDPSERVAVELDATSARRLAETILSVLDHPEARPYMPPDLPEAATA